MRLHESGTNVGSGGVQLAARLRVLKDRTGRSYEALAGRAGASRSALHRYCTGTIVPAEFQPIERFAKVCGASGDEVQELYRLWIIADAQRDRRRGVPRYPSALVAPRMPVHREQWAGEPPSWRVRAVARWMGGVMRRGGPGDSYYE